ncbi:MAG: monooxygenase, partial [Nitrosomonas halophila]
PGIEKISGQRVHFVDGSAADYEVVIAATGYKISFPFFDRALIDWEQATQIPLYLRIFHPDHPSLFFVGLIQPQGAIWPLTDLQSQLIAQLLTHRIQLPSNWRELAIAEGKYWQQQFILHPRHALEVHYHRYRQQLLKLTRSPA